MQLLRGDSVHKVWWTPENVRPVVAMGSVCSTTLHGFHRIGEEFSREVRTLLELSLSIRPGGTHSKAERLCTVHCTVLCTVMCTLPVYNAQSRTVQATSRPARSPNTDMIHFLIKYTQFIFSIFQIFFSAWTRIIFF